MGLILLRLRVEERGRIGDRSEGRNLKKLLSST